MQRSSGQISRKQLSINTFITRHSREARATLQLCRWLQRQYALNRGLYVITSEMTDSMNERWQWKAVDIEGLRQVHLVSLCCLLLFILGMWRSSHSNSTMFELWTFSADSKFVEFFHVPIVEFEPQVYTIGTTCLHPPATGTTNWTNAHCLIVWKDRK